MRIVYNGPHPEVVVDELDQDTVIVRGEPVNVHDELGARLVMQDTWDDVTPEGMETPAQKQAREDKAAAQAEADAEAARAQAAADADNATEGNN